VKDDGKNRGYRINVLQEYTHLHTNIPTHTFMHAQEIFKVYT
jgi:hypothetical protein